MAIAAPMAKSGIYINHSTSKSKPSKDSKEPKEIRNSPFPKFENFHLQICPNTELVLGI
jgi:hypothetical protein